jgi:hypothetical protein
MANTTAELTWLAFILKDLRITLSSPPILYCDNLSALHMTVNPVFHARSKHIELDYHFVRERVARGLLVTQHISSVNQVADLFTKPMSKALFNISATNFASSPDKVCGRVLTTYCNLALLALPTIVRVNGEIRIHEILGEKRVVTLTI